MYAGNHPPSEMTVKARKFRGLNFFRNSSLKFQKSGVLTTASLNGKKQTVPGEVYGWIRTERKKSGKPPTSLLTSKLRKKDYRFYDSLWPQALPLYREFPQAGKQEWAFRYKTQPGVKIGQAE